MTPDPSILLVTEQVTKSFGGSTVVRAVDLTVHKGEIVGVIGPNGAGKTTLFNLITGMYRADRGKVFFRGQEITHLGPAERCKQGIARTFQLVRPFQHMTLVIPNGCANLAFIGQFVELPLDVVFTVETSVRTALLAVWGLTGLDKPMVPVYEPSYDLRVIAGNLRASLGIEQFSLRSLPRILRSGPSPKLVIRQLKTLPAPQ
jgi:ABC-type Fe3+/spermidine/putrescine transport system ATPase subunit